MEDGRPVAVTITEVRPGTQAAERPQLERGLAAAFAALAEGGRLVVICFTRWEMAAVRAFLRAREVPLAAESSDPAAGAGARAGGTDGGGAGGT